MCEDRLSQEGIHSRDTVCSSGGGGGGNGDLRGSGIVKRFATALAINIAANIIQWPVGERATTVADGFRMTSHGFPGIVGAVEWLPHPNKRTDPRPSVLCQLERFSFDNAASSVCDYECLLANVYAGWPGRVHDARVFRNSPLSERLPTLPPDRHCLGDSAYPLTPSLMVPYKGALTPTQDNFNTRLSRARQCIERSFALFKCSWRRMKYFDASGIKHMCNSIVACCVRHNLCLLHNDSAADMMSNDDDGADGDCDDDNDGDNAVPPAAGNQAHADAGKVKRNNTQAQLMAAV